jgi:hypothetical protein
MFMNRFWLGSLFSGLLFFASVAGADGNVLVFPFEGINVDEDLVRATTITLANELETQGYRSILFRPVSAGIPKPEKWEETMDSEQAVQPETPSELEAAMEGEAAPLEDKPPGSVSPVEMEKAAAGKMGCEYYLQGSLIRLGEQMTLYVDLYSADGKRLASKKMPARTEEDLVIVIPRMTIALLGAKTVEETRNMDNATRAETGLIPQRFRFEKNFGFVMGQFFKTNENTNNFTVMVFDARLEFNQFLVEMDVGVGFGNREFKGTNFMMDLGLSYYLTHSSVAPYVGAGVGIFLGPRVNDSKTCGEDYYDGDYYSECDQESFVGWNVYPTIGVEFLRQTAIRLHADFRYLFNITEHAWGHGPMASVGINF